MEKNKIARGRVERIVARLKSLESCSNPGLAGGASDLNPAPKKNLRVSLMRREFTVACPEEESEELHEAAAYLDRQMRGFADGGPAAGFERCAVMAGLNLGHALLRLRKAMEKQSDTARRLENLDAQVDRLVPWIEQPPGGPARRCRKAR